MKAETLLAVDDVAAQLSVTRRTVYALVHRGQLDAVKVGSVMRIAQSAVEAFKRSAKVQPESVSEPAPVKKVSQRGSDWVRSIKGHDRYLQH